MLTREEISSDMPVWPPPALTTHLAADSSECRRAAACRPCGYSFGPRPHVRYSDRPHASTALKTARRFIDRKRFQYPDRVGILDLFQQQQSVPLGQLVHAVGSGAVRIRPTFWHRFSIPTIPLVVYSRVPVMNRWCQLRLAIPLRRILELPRRSGLGDIPLRHGAAGPRGSAGGLLRTGAQMGSAQSGGVPLMS